MNKSWKPHEIRFVHENAAKLTDNEIRLKLLELFKKKVSLAAIRKFRQREGIEKISGRGRCGVKPKQTRSP